MEQDEEVLNPYSDEEHNEKGTRDNHDQQKTYAHY